MLTQPSFWFSLISIVLAIYAAYTSWQDTHRKIQIYCNWMFKAGDQFNVSFNFFNPSSKNMAINNITLVENGKSYPSNRAPLLLADRTSSTAFSTPLPINVSSGTSMDAPCPFQFLDEQMEPKKYTFIFHIMV